MPEPLQFTTVLEPRGEDEDGAQRVHWHLSPNTPRLLQRVRDAIGVADPNTNERVIRQQ